MKPKEKICIKCLQTKEAESFYKRSKSNEDCRHSECKSCSKVLMREWREKNKDRNSETSRRNRLKFYYNMTPDQYESLLKTQNYSCAICKGVPTGSGNNNRSLHVDHDHQTGGTRGLLCSTCNKGLGLFYDNRVILLSAAKYLKKHKEKR